MILKSINYTSQNANNENIACIIGDYKKVKGGVFKQCQNLGKVINCLAKVDL